MRAAKIAIAVLSALLFAALFLPCVRVTFRHPEAGTPQVTLLVGNTLLRDVGNWMPYALYLLAAPVVSAVACVGLLGLGLSRRATMWAGFGGVAFLVVPNLSIPKVKIGAMTAWALRLTPLDLRSTWEVLYGFHVYRWLIGALAVAYLALGIASLLASRRAQQEQR